jgi:hypothetical protein
MFESLDEQIKKDDDLVSSIKDRMMRWALYVLAAVVVFGGLIFAVRSLG